MSSASPCYPYLWKNVERKIYGYKSNDQEEDTREGAEIKSELRNRLHRKIPETGEWLKSVLVGYYRYYGVSGNLGALKQFRFQILKRWHLVLKRRSQKRKYPKLEL